MSLALDHIQLAIPPGGEPAARAFWCDLIGLPEIAKPAALQARGGLWLSLGTQELHLGVEDGFTPAQKAHPAFRVATPGALETLATRLTAATHPVTPANDIPGRQRFFSEDPFGNRLEFLAPPTSSSCP